jgi:hypothetical protein
MRPPVVMRTKYYSYIQESSSAAYSERANVTDAREILRVYTWRHEAPEV